MRTAFFERHRDFSAAFPETVQRVQAFAQIPPQHQQHLPALLRDALHTAVKTPARAGRIGVVIDRRMQRGAFRRAREIREACSRSCPPGIKDRELHNA